MKSVEEQLRKLQNVTERDSIRRRQYANELLKSSPNEYDDAGIDQLVALYLAAKEEGTIREDINDTMKAIGNRLQRDADIKYKVLYFFFYYYCGYY